MIPATMSILGIYQYENDIFDNLVIPEALTDSRETIIDTILTDCCELEILYTDVDFLKFIIGVWSKKEMPIWQKLYDTTNLEYNPIENYDRQEEWTDTGNEAGTQTGTQTNTGTNTESGKGGGESSGTSSSTTNTNGTDTGSVVAFNTDEFKDSTKSVSTASGTDSGENASKVNSAYESTINTTDKIDRNLADSRNTNTNHTGRVHGNIGVTTSQQMIEAQRNVVRFNIIDEIVQSFKRRFCILIY